MEFMIYINISHSCIFDKNVSIFIPLIEKLRYDTKKQVLDQGNVCYPNCFNWLYEVL